MKCLLIILLTLSSLAYAELKLEIKRPDGSIYWVEHFSKTSDLNKWLATEKTRKYWNKEYTTVISGEENNGVVNRKLTPKEVKSKAKLEAALAKESMSAQDIQNVLKVLAEDALGDLVQ